jgi:hypothetical protein
MRIILRSAAALMALALMASPARANEEDLETNPGLMCRAYCFGTASVCLATNQSEFCAGYLDGCLQGCQF